jgi:hypothetical protein
MDDELFPIRLAVGRGLTLDAHLDGFGRHFAAQLCGVSPPCGHLALGILLVTAVVLVTMGSISMVVCF